MKDGSAKVCFESVWISSLLRFRCNLHFPGGTAVHEHAVDILTILLFAEIYDRYAGLKGSINSFRCDPSDTHPGRSWWLENPRARELGAENGPHVRRSFENNKVS